MLFIYSNNPRVLTAIWILENTYFLFPQATAHETYESFGDNRFVAYLQKFILKSEAKLSLVYSIPIDCLDTTADNWTYRDGFQILESTNIGGLANNMLFVKLNFHFDKSGKKVSKIINRNISEFNNVIANIFKV